MKQGIIDNLEKRNISAEFIDKIRFNGKIIHCYLDIYGKFNITVNAYEYQEISEKELRDFMEWLLTLELKAEAQTQK